MKADGVHEVALTRPLLDTRLREFVNDTLRAAEVRESALFDHCAVVNVLDEHYHGARRHHKTLAAMLDLALAEQQLTGRARPTPAAARA